MTPARILFQGAAIAASLYGYLIIAPAFFSAAAAKQLSVGEGVTLLTLAAVYGWWPAAVAAATSGIRGAFLALVILDVLWAFLGQGVGGFVFCAVPFCPDFAPWSDVARYGSLVAGAFAAWTAWRGYRALTGPTQWIFPVTAVALTILSFTLQGIYAKF